MKKCNNCGKTYDNTVKGAINKYCSKKCGRKDYYEKNKTREKSNCAKWYDRHRKAELEKNKEYRNQNRELFHWYHNKDRFSGMREVILSRDNNRCKVCNSEKVVIHHKDGSGESTVGRKDVRINNDINNLITLCHPCHMSLHFWQKRNKKVLVEDEEITRVIGKIRYEKRKG